MNKISLEEIAGGALKEQFEKAFAKVIENLADPNTSFKETRKITITLKFNQNEQRDDVLCEINVAEKLAAQAHTRTSFSVGKDLKIGDLYAEEYGKLKGQTSMLDFSIDTDTGEVLEEKNENLKILNLRKVN